MNHPLSELRLQLLANGYQIIPGLDKTCRVKGWNSNFLDREVKRWGSYAAAVKYWDRGRRDHLTTNVLVTDRLCPWDCDVDDPQLALALGGIIQDVVPEVSLQAPARFGSGQHKVAYFTRLAYGEETFIRLASRKYALPAEIAVWRANPEQKPKHHQLEVFGSAPTRAGKVSRQFGIYGPHTAAREGVEGIEYAWAEGPQLADTPLQALPQVTVAQVHEVIDRFDAAAVALGFEAIEAEGGPAGGGWVYDIDRETQRFDTSEDGRISYSELEDLVAERGEVRCSFAGMVTSRPRDKCLAGWSDKHDCVMVTEWGANLWHLPIDKDTGWDGLKALAPEFEHTKTKSEQEKAAEASVEAERDAAGEAPTTWNGVVTQDAVALKFAEIHANRLRYCHHTGAWFDWTGLRWLRDETALAFQFSRELARTASRGANLTGLKEARKVSFAGGVEKFARGDRRMAVTSAEWDRDPFKMGTPEGTLDLRTGRLHAPDPTDGISKLTAVAPRQGVPRPIWDRFLWETFNGDEELIRFNQCWFGYCMTGDTREHSLWFGFGNGGNGKGVLLNTVSQIIGEYARTAPMDTFTAKKFDSHPTELAMLRGARLVSASETEEGRSWAESRIKQLTGGDQVAARFMHKDFFTFWPAFKLAMIGNHKPVLRNVDAAVRRRFKLVPFMNDVPEHLQDRQLSEKLKAEWAGIMQWMVEGCLAWQAGGLIVPDAVRRATDSYFEEQDTMGQWLAAACERHPSAVTPSAELFTAWAVFAHQAGETTMTRKAFTMELARRGFEPSRTETSRNITGLRLKKAGSRPFFTIDGGVSDDKPDAS